MRDAGFDDWLDAVTDGEGYYLACPEGHGALPPRRVCPECGSTDLEARPLPDRGTVETFTEVHVAGPEFAADAPYVTAIASFGPVRLTGVLRGLSAADVAVGATVEPGVDESETTGERLLVLRPA
ncbi:MAG: Zn-ribbon domain-containing OB-fold protein [Salinigranum sp.]